MRAVYLHCTGGINSGAILKALVGLGVDEQYIVNQLKELYPLLKGHVEDDNLMEAIMTAENYSLSKSEIFKAIDNYSGDAAVGSAVKRLVSNIVELDEYYLANEAVDKKGLKDILFATAIVIAYMELKCHKAYTSSIEINGCSSLSILELLKEKKVKFKPEGNCSYDYVAVVFISLFCQTERTIEGKLIVAAAVKDETVEIKAMIMEENNLDEAEEDIQQIVECNIDDMNSEGYEYIFNRLLAVGALDVFITPIIMKKGRPAVKLSALCTKDKLEEVKLCIFKETSTFGVRSYSVEKAMLKRTFGKIIVHGEAVRVKYGYLNDKVIKAKPEYEDCKRIAEQKGLGLNNVYLEAVSNIPPFS